MGIYLWNFEDILESCKEAAVKIWRRKKYYIMEIAKTILRNIEKIFGKCLGNIEKHLGKIRQRFEWNSRQNLGKSLKKNLKNLEESLRIDFINFE